MNIIIAGNGKVGATLTRLLSAEGHDITLIDTVTQVLMKLKSGYGRRENYAFLVKNLSKQHTLHLIIEQVQMRMVKITL